MTEQWLSSVIYLHSCWKQLHQLLHSLLNDPSKNNGMASSQIQSQYNGKQSPSGTVMDQMDSSQPDPAQVIFRHDILPYYDRSCTAYDKRIEPVIQKEILWKWCPNIDSSCGRCKSTETILETYDYHIFNHNYSYIFWRFFIWNFWNCFQQGLENIFKIFVQEIVRPQRFSSNFEFNHPSWK